MSFSSGFPTSALLTFWTESSVQWGLFCASYIRSSACPPQWWQTHLQTLAYAVGTGTWTPRAENHLLNWMRSGSHFDTGVSLKSYSACYPRYQIPALPRLAFLSQSISHSGGRVILCALSACVRESKGRYLLILLLKIPHWLIFWNTNDSKGKCWYFRGIYTFFFRCWVYIAD